MTDRVLIAISRYYKHISDELEQGALEVLVSAPGSLDRRR